MSVNNHITIKLSILRSLSLEFESENELFKHCSAYLLKKKNDIIEEYKYALLIRNFLNEIQSLDSIHEIRKKYNDFVKIQISENYNIGDIFTLYLDDDDSENWVYGIKISNDSIKYTPQIGCEKLFQIDNAYKKVSQKTIVNIINIFEDFFRKLLKVLIQNNPEMYFFDKTVKYNDIINSSIDEITEKIITEEADRLMYDVADTLEKINKKHQLHLDNYRELWDNYIEMNLRRNLIVHNGCNVNTQYINKLPQCFKKPELNSELLCDDVYVEKSIENLLKFSYLLVFLCGKTKVEETILDTEAFSFLCDMKWSIAEFSYELLLKKRNVSNEEKIINLINLLLSKKMLYGIDKTRQDIKNIDVSGMDSRYVIAKELLLENHKKVNDLLRETYPKSFDFYMIQTWPLFIDYRNSIEYTEFLEEHNEEYKNYKQGK